MIPALATADMMQPANRTIRHAVQGYAVVQMAHSTCGQVQEAQVGVHDGLLPDAQHADPCSAAGRRRCLYLTDQLQGSGSQRLDGQSRCALRRSDTWKKDTAVTMRV
jgi:hypothetical protein